MTDHIVDINKKVQSSDAAEAIFFAADGMQPRQYRGRALAAALRALADQSENLYDPHEGKVSVVRTDDLLAIATKLENAQ